MPKEPPSTHAIAVPTLDIFEELFDELRASASHINSELSSTRDKTEESPPASTQKVQEDAESPQEPTG